MTATRLLAALLLVAATGAAARAMRHIDVPQSRLSEMPYDVAAWNGRDAEPLDTDTVRILSADEYLNRTYNSGVAAAPVNLYIAYYGQQQPIRRVRARRPFAPQPANRSAVHDSNRRREREDQDRFHCSEIAPASLVAR